MAAHQIARGLWTAITPRPTLVQVMATRGEVLVSADVPDLLAHGIEAPQAEPFEVPAGEGILYARIHPDSAYSTGTLLSLETPPAET